MYYRHFKIIDKELCANIIQRLKDIHAYKCKLHDLAISLGATGAYASEVKLVGFAFDEPDRELYKPVGRMAYYPKKTSKRGKEIISQIEALGQPPEEVNSLISPMLPNGADFCFHDSETHRIYSAYLRGSEDAGWFLVVPWKDVDPVELRAYRADRSKGVCGDAELDHLLWKVPTDKFEEIKEWQMLKALDTEMA